MQAYVNIIAHPAIATFILILYIAYIFISVWVCISFYLPILLIHLFFKGYVIFQLGKLLFNLFSR